MEAEYAAQIRKVLALHSETHGRRSRDQRRIIHVNTPFFIIMNQLIKKRKGKYFQRIIKDCVLSSIEVFI